MSELAWLAGLLEGEGCFGYYSYPTVKLEMTDRDVVERAHPWFAGSVCEYRRGDDQPTFTVRVTGERAIRLMLQVRPHMGARRSAKIDTIVRRWDGATGE